MVTSEFRITLEGMMFTTFYKGVWSRKTNSILYFGGYNYKNKTQVSNVISQFSPSLDVWSILPTTGEGPSSRQDHCMEITDDGSKIVVFGGSLLVDNTTIFLNDIYVLDVNAMAWRRGPEYHKSVIKSACTLVGSTFISWGGQEFDNSTTISSEAILYDINSMEYISRFIPPPPSPTMSPQSTSLGSGSKVSSSTAVIMGAIVGALGLVALGAGAYLWKKSVMFKSNGKPEDKLVKTEFNDPTGETGVYVQDIQGIRVHGEENWQELYSTSIQGPQEYQDVTSEYRAPQQFTEIHSKYYEYVTYDQTPGSPQQTRNLEPWPQHIEDN
ncbi:hypothetical protein BGX28_000029 [Mortierella sp. GBA30]|nr:hypothetical protein BGX28_000029 [Mortierella sp. GBA30]